MMAGKSAYGISFSGELSGESAGVGAGVAVGSADGVTEGSSVTVLAGEGDGVSGKDGGCVLHALNRPAVKKQASKRRNMLSDGEKSLWRL